MFDRTFIQPPAQNENVHVTTTVHEHRAPTDESVKILREMEEKAFAQVIDVMISKAGDNTLGVATFNRNFATDDTMVVFSLNGCKIRATIPRDLTADKRKWLDNIAAEIGKAVGMMVVSKALGIGALDGRI